MQALRWDPREPGPPIRKGIFKKTIHHMFIVQTETGTDYIPVLTHNGTYIVMCMTVCIFRIDRILLFPIHVITRSVYTVTYIDVDSLLDLYRNRIKSASGY